MTERAQSELKDRLSALIRAAEAAKDTCLVSPLSVACPRCAAQAGDPCTISASFFYWVRVKGSLGKPRQPHAARIRAAKKNR